MEVILIFVVGIIFLSDWEIDYKITQTLEYKLLF